MEIDHMFIFSNNDGKEADKLVEFGLREGSSRIHPGQGTINRKFYFENFFLEILWVIDESEIKSKLTSETKLWERSKFKELKSSRFGLCLVNSEATDSLFMQSQSYQPDYFPEGMSIDIITNQNLPKLPWTFRLPYRGTKKNSNEPLQYNVGINFLTKIGFEIPKNKVFTSYLNHFKNSDQIEFLDGKQTRVIMEFDHCRQAKTSEFPELDLTLKY